MEMFLGIEGISKEVADLFKRLRAVPGNIWQTVTVKNSREKSRRWENGLLKCSKKTHLFKRDVNEISARYEMDAGKPYLALTETILFLITRYCSGTGGFYLPSDSKRIYFTLAN